MVRICSAMICARAESARAEGHRTQTGAGWCDGGVSTHLDVGGLTLDAPGRRLVDHRARVGQREPLALGATAQQEGAHRRREADVDRGHVRLDVAHRVEDGEARLHRAAGRVDVHRDLFVVVLGVEVEHDCDQLIGELIVDLRPEEEDALAVHAVVDVDPIGAPAVRAARGRPRFGEERQRVAPAPRLRPARAGRPCSRASAAVGFGERPGFQKTERVAAAHIAPGGRYATFGVPSGIMTGGDKRACRTEGPASGV
eukprot:6771983-Prymnesium_polylepis.1